MADQTVIDLIKQRKDIPISLLEFIRVEGDGNCLFRTFSVYLYEIETRYKQLREQIYNYAKTNKEEIKDFF